MFLLIDTCQKSCNLSLIKDKEIIDSISVPTNNNLTDLVVELISEMFNKNNIKINEINRIYLTNGPGSFTGIRVGLIITKLWATIYNIKIYIIDSLQFQTTTKNFISAIDAHNGAYYCTIFINNKLILKNKLITKKLLDNYLNKFKGIPYFLDVDFSGIKKTEKFPKFKLTNIRNTKGNYIKKPINN